MQILGNEKSHLQFPFDEIILTYSFLAGFVAAELRVFINPLV